MKTAVVGAGAMGSLFGAFLAEAGEDVKLLNRSKKHVDVINADGLIIESHGTTRIVPMKAETDPLKIGLVDLVIICVKSPDTKAAAETAASLVGDTGIALTLQNGMGNADIIAAHMDPKQVIAGTTAHGATLLEPGKIRYAGAGPTVIGMWAGGDRAMAEKTAALLNHIGIETTVTDDVKSLVWSKLMINVGINALTALTNIKNGRILDLPVTMALSEAAVTEAAGVARAHGISIPEDVVENVFKVAKATGPNRSSMGQDVDRRRQTEVGAINGFIVKAGQQKGVPVPVNSTLTALVLTLQGHYGKK